MRHEKTKPLDPMKKWIAEAGTDTPGDEFHLSVLTKIEALPKAAADYRPVISPLAWTLIFGFVLSVIVWSVLSAPAQPDTPTMLDGLRRLKIPLPKFGFVDYPIFSPDFSPQFLIGIGTFFIMGLLTIIGATRNKRANV